MNKQIAFLSILFAVSCDGARPRQIQEVLVVISHDGKCLVDYQPHDCGTIGGELVRDYPDREISVRLDVHPQADYLVVASVLRGIREAKIEKTWFIDKQGGS